MNQPGSLVRCIFKSPEMAITAVDGIEFRPARSDEQPTDFVAIACIEFPSDPWQDTNQVFRAFHDLHPQNSKAPQALGCQSRL
jgi:hypothetical protein